MYRADDVVGPFYVPNTPTLHILKLSLILYGTYNYLIFYFLSLNFEEVSFLFF